MLKILLLSSALIVGFAASATAAPTTDLDQYRAYDRFDHILHPDEEVGPEIDDDNPLLDPPMYQVDIWKILDEPDPREVVVDVVVVR
jgi:hypothetical protein